MNFKHTSLFILAISITVGAMFFISSPQPEHVSTTEVTPPTPTTTAVTTKPTPVAPKDLSAQAAAVTSARPTTTQLIKSKPDTTATITIEGTSFEVPVHENQNVYDVMEALQTRGSITFTSREYLGMGHLILAVNGKSSNSDMTWIFYVNGKVSQAGVSSVRVLPKDVIEWKYEKAY